MVAATAGSVQRRPLLSSVILQREEAIMTADIEVGASAPEFSLVDHKGEIVRSEDLHGRWVVLYFYPEDDTPGCTTEACEFTESVEAFTELDATVLGCSPDSPESHRRFIERHNLGIRLLSDPEHRVMERYGAWGEKNLYGKVSVGVIRSTVIIDPEGAVAHRWKRASAKGHAVKVRDALARLRERSRRVRGRSTVRQ
jgi:peroxiredoxin Q/BCP